jgi:hypothetical protein
MPHRFAIFTTALLLLASASPCVHAQGVEPGLERAVKWKWNVAPPTSAAWGLPQREVPVLQQRSSSQAANPAASDQNIYTVKKVMC